MIVGGFTEFAVKMLKRTLTSALVVAVMLGAFLLRELVDFRLFYLLIYAFALIGTFEMLRALDKRVNLYTKVIVWSYALALTPIFTFLGESAALIASFSAFILVLSSFVIEFYSSTVESVGCGLLALFYPTGLLYAMLKVNAFAEKGFVPMLLLFVIAVLSDVGAYLIGSAVRGKKLSPDISPKKTVSGFIGGLITGSIGALLVYFVFNGQAKGIIVSSDLEWLIFLAIGLFGAAISAFGDLVEGGLKRKLGIKDMGELLPGHGGILDRIDSTMFSAVLVFFVFAVALS